MEAAVEVVSEAVVVAVVAAMAFDDEPDAVGVAVEPVKQLTAVGTVTPLSPQSCLAYAAAMA